MALALGWLNQGSEYREEAPCGARSWAPPTAAKMPAMLQTPWVVCPGGGSLAAELPGWAALLKDRNLASSTSLPLLLPAHCQGSQISLSGE